MSDFSLQDRLQEIDNPNRRCACLLLLDISSSMAGAPIASLNEGLKSFERAVKEDSQASLSLDIGIITFGSEAKKLMEFTSGAEFVARELTCSGSTPMGQAIIDGVQMVKDRKNYYKQQDLDYYRPWILMITDGSPTDSPALMERARQLLQSEINSNGLIFFAVGVAGANMENLAGLTDRVVKLEGLKFQELFNWLSKSIKTRLSSANNTQVALPPTGGFAASVY
jgi:uncharacterized protein YegL